MLVIIADNAAALVVVVKRLAVGFYQVASSWLCSLNIIVICFCGSGPGCIVVTFVWPTIVIVLLCVHTSML